MKADECDRKLKKKEEELEAVTEAQTKEWEEQLQQAIEKVSKAERDLSVITEKLSIAENEKQQAEKSMKEQAAKIAEMAAKKDELDKVRLFNALIVMLPWGFVAKIHISPQCAMYLDFWR